MKLAKRSPKPAQPEPVAHPVRYRILTRVVLEAYCAIEADSQEEAEQEALRETRSMGEMIDWEVKIVEAVDVPG